MPQPVEQGALTVTTGGMRLAATATGTPTTRSDFIATPPRICSWPRTRVGNTAPSARRGKSPLGPQRAYPRRLVSRRARRSRPHVSGAGLPQRLGILLRDVACAALRDRTGRRRDEPSVAGDQRDLRIGGADI